MAKSQQKAATASQKAAKSTLHSSLKETVSSPKHPFEPLPEGHSIEYCFTLDGLNHFQVRDAMNTFSARALEGISAYEKWGMRCTPEFLKAHQLAKKNIYNSSKIEITKLIDLDNKLDERLNFALPTEDIIYQFAAVTIFDETESPYRYDPSYAKVKIKRWKESESKELDFFLMLRGKGLILSPEFSEEDLKLILSMVNQISRSHLDQVSSTLSSDQRKTDFFQELLYQQSLNSIGID